MALSNKQKAQVALNLYLGTTKTQKEICELVGWTERTFTLNKNKGKWEELKGAHTITVNKIVANLLIKAKELSEKDIEDFSPDKLVKIASSIEKLQDRKVTISQSMNVFKDFTSWCITRDEEAAKLINSLMAEYINDKING